VSDAKPMVYVARRVPPRVEAELRRSFTLRYHDFETPPSREELLRTAVGVDAVLSMLTDRIDAGVIDAAGAQLRIVANYAVGYDNVDVAACASRGVLVTNTPDVLTRATAELTIALLLDVTRRVSEGDRLVRARSPWIWAPTFHLGVGVDGRTLGVVGLGRIGRAVADLAAALGMSVVYSSRSEVAAPYRRVDLAELLRSADVVSLHCPLSNETRHLIGAAELRMMRSDGFLINTTRGSVVDEAALAAALRDRAIAGAALDVYEHEPIVHEELLSLENVVLAPHLGSSTLETREAMGMVCVEALRDVLLAGRRPRHVVNAAPAA
jgi:glyoxylate reductase